MKTIEERAKLASEGYEDDGYSAGLYMGYIVGATEQKAIDEKEIREQESIYIDKACYIFCYTGCPHKTDDYDCLKDKCAAWEKFRKMMEE